RPGVLGLNVIQASAVADVVVVAEERGAGLHCQSAARSRYHRAPMARSCGPQPRAPLEKTETVRYHRRMSPQETERRFLSLLTDCLVSLPFDLKVLQEAVADPNLDRAARDIAAGAIVHTLLPQEGEGPLRFVDDALLVRAALRGI